MLSPHSSENAARDYHWDLYWNLWSLQCIYKWSREKNKEEKQNLCWGVMKTEIDYEDLEEKGMMLSDGQ